MKREPEQWKTIKGFPNYMISSWGRVWSKSHLSAKGPHILPAKTNHDGYYEVRLWKCGHEYSRRVNRLVAQAFVSNPHHYPIVNHKDENKKDNYYKNLEWCTNYYNVHYSMKRHPERLGCYFTKHLARYTPVILYKGFCESYYFNSCTNASKFLNIPLHSYQQLVRYNHTNIHGWNILPFK